MENASKTLRRLLLPALFLAVGGALTHVAYQITPAFGDRTIPFSEWRSRYRLGSAVSTLGDITLLMGLLFSWAVMRGAARARRARHHSVADRDVTPPEE